MSAVPTVVGLSADRACLLGRDIPDSAVDVSGRHANSIAPLTRHVNPCYDARMTTTYISKVIEGVEIVVEVEDHDGPSVFVHVTTTPMTPTHVIVDGEEVYC